MVEEKIFTIPLREAFITQRTRRAKRAVNVVRDFLIRHMKSENIKIGDSINKEIWSRGIQKPPRRVRVHAILQDGAVYSELIGVEIKATPREALKKKEQKKKEKKEKIKEERKERKKKSIQEELDEGSGKTLAPAAPVEGKAELKEEKELKAEAKTEKRSFSS